MLGVLHDRLTRGEESLPRRHAGRAGSAVADRTAAPSPHLGPDSPLRLSLAGRTFKRFLDLCLAPVLLLLAVPVLLVAMVAIRIDSKGPAVFRQVRVGAGGKRFRLYKLRTMFADNDDSAHRAYTAALIAGSASRESGMFKLVDDPRVTRVGRFLRRFSIDEVPQLWNVIRGDMSLVGPRPPLPNEADLYDAWAWQRLSSKPGITGLWQVSGRCRLSFDEMVRLDIRYLQEWSPFLELKIVLKSPFVVFLRQGAA